MSTNIRALRTLWCLVVAVLAGGLAVLVSASPVHGADDNAGIAFRYFVGKGLSEFQAAGIIGNFEIEAPGVNPTQHQLPSGPGRGIAQWEIGSRWDTNPGDNLLQYANGRDPYALATQLDFTWYELLGIPYRGLDALRGTTTIRDATLTFMAKFEGCGNCYPDNRVAAAQNAWNKYHGTGTQGPPSWPSFAEPGRVVSARSGDGRLETFAAGSDGVWHTWQTAVNGKWSPWRFEAGPADARLAVARNADGRLELWALNGSVMQHKFQTTVSGEWGGWEDFGTGGDNVVAANNADGRLEVFASNPNGVFHKYQTGASTWSDWTGFPGGPASAQLQVERSSDGRMELFALNGSTFEHLFQTKPSGGWGSWEHFGDGGRALTVDHNSDGRLEVFASNPNGVFHKWQVSATTWSAWTGTGGPASAKLTSTRTSDGRVEVFAMNGSTLEHLFQTAPNKQYGSWENFGGPGTGVQVANDADGRMELFGTSSAGVFHRWQTGPNTWSQWEGVNSTTGPPMP